MSSLVCCEVRLDKFGDRFAEQRTAFGGKMDAIRRQIAVSPRVRDDAKQVVNRDIQVVCDLESDGIIRGDIGLQPIEPLPLMMPDFVDRRSRRSDDSAIGFRQNASEKSTEI